MRGKVKVLILNLKPNIEIIQAVSVVPMLAPIIKLADSDKDNRPAFTKLITIIVMADDDCKPPVIKAPDKIPLGLFFVMAARFLRRPMPADLCKASLIMRMPYINKPKEPKRVNIESSIFILSCKFGMKEGVSC